MSAPRILVVDDDKNLLEIARTRLTANNYDVTIARGSEEALEATKAQNFDLVILDLRLADEDGMTLMEKLHALYPGTPVIILTAYASVEGAVKAMKRGAYTYLTKPFDPRELILQRARALVVCRRDRFDRLHSRGKRHGQGADRQGDPSCQRAKRSIVRCDQLRRDSGVAA